jgi:hypothetical protein
MNGDLVVADLKPGDVVLYRGDSLLAKLIRLFDGTDVNHAGIYIGGGLIGEAIAEGVVSRAVKDSLADHDWVLIRRLKDNAPLDPVIARATTIIAEKHRYAYEQLLLLAILSISRKLKITPILRFLVRKILDAAATVLNKFIADATGSKEPMICSEYVFRCYDEALPQASDAYSLEINRVASAAEGGGGAIAAVLPRTRGRGVSPDSLLAWSVGRTPVTTSWSAPPTAALTTVAPGEEVSEEDLEPLIEQYLAEVQGKAPQAALAATPTVTDAELQGALERFSIAFVKASGGTSGAAILAADPAGAAIASVAQVHRTASDFVTPGDLLMTESLFTAGKIPV